VRIFGDRTDLEWIYAINSIKRTIRVYGGGYTDEKPHLKVASGVVDPINYVKYLHWDCRETYAKQIRAAIRSLGRIGFPVNPKRTSARREAHAAQRARKLSPS
jgi:hypothetical protein